MDRASNVAPRCSCLLLTTHAICDRAGLERFWDAAVATNSGWRLPKQRRRGPPSDYWRLTAINGNPGRPTVTPEGRGFESSRLRNERMNREDLPRRSEAASRDDNAQRLPQHSPNISLPTRPLGAADGQAKR
jgi:hypothetical protein